MIETPSRMSEQIVRARWVFPITRPPIESGWVHIDGQRIRAVGGPGDRTPDIDLGNVALIPGLVNPHTHLDLSGCADLALKADDFVAWLESVVARRRASDAIETDEAIRAGLAESRRAGVTLLGDISGDGSSWDVLATTPIHAVVFRELIGLTEARVIEARSLAENWLRDHPRTNHIRAGLSPHAPYSVRGSLFEAVAALAQMHRCPIAIHVAESLAEMRLLDRHAGPLRDFLEQLGVWDESGLIRDHDALIATFARTHPMAWVHANQLPAGTLPGRIYCPRTHANFGFGAYPLRECLAAGETIAIATDSLASNPDLDPLAEARFVREHFPDIDLSTLLRMITLWGAKLLGFDPVTGSLEPGKWADLLVIPLADHDPSDPHRFLFDEPVPTTDRRTMWCGEWQD